MSVEADADADVTADQRVRHSCIAELKCTNGPCCHIIRHMNASIVMQTLSLASRDNAGNQCGLYAVLTMVTSSH